MNEITLEEAKTIGVNILKSVHDFCATNNLRYSIMFGTLLGAVRHKGYIPWDDDIDIAMPREDYEFFINNFNNQYYGVMSYKTNKYYPLPYAKAYSKNTIKIEPFHFNKRFQIGFNIDIFPFDTIGNEKYYWSKYINEKKYIYLFYKSLQKPYGSTKLKYVIRSLFLLPFWLINKLICKKIDRCFINNDVNINNYAHNEIWEPTYNKAYVFPKNMFNDVIKMEFEGNYFYASKDYDAILKIIYGDYMVLPPVEKRRGHTFKAYYL